MIFFGIKNDSLEYKSLHEYKNNIDRLLDDSNMIIEHEFLNYKSDIDKYKNKIEILKKE